MLPCGLSIVISISFLPSGSAINRDPLPIFLWRVVDMALGTSRHEVLIHQEILALLYYL